MFFEKAIFFIKMFHAQNVFRKIWVKKLEFKSTERI